MPEVITIIVDTTETIDINQSPSDPVAIISQIGSTGPPGQDGVSGATLHAELTDTDTDGHPASAITGLGGAAVLNVGTTAGTVAAGDDSRFTNSRTPAGAVSVIARTVLGSDAASVDFTSIPATYENLIVEWVVRGTASTAWPWLYCQVNGDTTSNYGSMTLHNSGSGAATDSQATTKWYCGYTVGATGTTGFAGSGRMWLPGYARTVFNKTFFSQFSAQYGANGNTAQVGTSQGAWGSTAAISSLSFTIETASFKAGSVFTLYGIAGA